MADSLRESVFRYAPANDRSSSAAGAHPTRGASRSPSEPRRSRHSLLASLVLALLFSATGCDRQDADRLARVGWVVAGKVRGLSPAKAPEGPWEALRDGGLEGRVRSRLRWDRFLAPLAIEVAVSGREVTLRGAVSDEALRRRAEELAESTAGVEKVTAEWADEPAK